MGVIWVDMGVIWVDTGVIWGNMGSYGGHIGVLWGGKCAPFFWNLPRDPPPLIFHNFGAQKNVPQSFGSGRDPPPFWNISKKKPFFFWIASLTMMLEVR